MLSASTKSSNCVASRPDRSTTAATTGLASSIAGILASVPLRAVPIGVRAAATIAARDVVVALCLPGASGVVGSLPAERGQSVPLNRYRYVKQWRRWEQPVKVIKSVDDALATIGEELGVSRWVDIDQNRIDSFADVTLDHQRLHVDVET